MKNKIAIASAFLAASSFATAEIVINDYLSFEGFIDMSYSHTDLDNKGIDDLDGSDNSFGIDQVEISWLFDFDPVTAQIDFDYEDNDDDVVEVEQAFFTYHLGDDVSAITAGRYASMLGFEAFEPTGLYQFSFAYDFGFGDIIGTPAYVQGVKYTYEGDSTFFGFSIQDEAFDNDEGRLGGSGDSTFGVEAAGSVILADGLGLFAGIAYEEGDGEDADNFAINSYLTYETGAWLFAAEGIYGEYDQGASVADLVTDSLGGTGTDEDVFQFLVMTNFAYSDQGSVTGRVSYSDHDFDITSGSSTVGADADFLKLTAAHGWAFTDNLLLVLEFSFVDGEIADEDYEAYVGAAELIFTF